MQTVKTFPGRGRLPFALVALLLALAGCSTVAPPLPERPPNIVVILADDQGYADVSAYGGDIPTPHIDSIAAAGIRFTDGYVTGPVCVPSRCGLLTGRQPARFRCASYSGNAIPPAEPTLAERLRLRGYATGLVGKWHMGETPGTRPLEQGFDEFFGFLGGLHLYLPEKESGSSSYLDFSREHSGALYRGEQEVDETEYLTDAFAREANAFIDRHRAEPFFLFLSFNAPHIPLQATPQYLARVPATVDEERRRTLAAMIIAMDDAVGSVLATLERLGLAEDTLVFYLSDNGGDPPVNRSFNDPLRGRKGELYEGGIRVPFMVQWKGVLPAGKVYRKPVSALDIVPTSIAATGATEIARPPLDGVNLLPYLQGTQLDQPNVELFWLHREQRALRAGDWKLLYDTERGDWALYNLREDIAESRDLAAEQPQLRADLKERLDKLEENVRGYHRVLPARNGEES